jgi:hypothetical protein
VCFVLDPGGSWEISIWPAASKDLCTVLGFQPATIVKKIVFWWFSLPRSVPWFWGDLLGLITVYLTKFESSFSHICLIFALLSFEIFSLFQLQ